jgi:hypothetical protein
MIALQTCFIVLIVVMPQKNVHHISYIYLVTVTFASEIVTTMMVPYLLPHSSSHSNATFAYHTHRLSFFLSFILSFLHLPICIYIDWAIPPPPPSS